MLELHRKINFREVQTMECSFELYRGGRLINVIVAFLRNHGVKNPIPVLSPAQKKIVYNDNSTVVTFVCTNYNHGYYEVLQHIDNAVKIIKTPVFFYFDGR